MFATGIVNHVNALEIVRHPWFMSAFLAGGLAQLVKLVLAYACTGKLRWREFFSSGGMPSGHASLVSALAFSVGITDGFSTPYAMVAVGFGLIVLVDAVTLRREAGEHAKLINSIIRHLNNVNDQERIDAKHLEERLGHSMREMLSGVLFGGAIAFAVCRI